MDQLKSVKVTERQQALQAVRQVFSQDHVVAKFHVSEGQSKPQNWLYVFQGLFEAVLNEKAAFVKQTTGKAGSSGATVRRRLTDAANTVRWLTERTVQYFNAKVMQAVLDHLQKTMKHKGELLEPVALDYIKAIRCILEWTPHLDRLDVAAWLRIVEMAFNVLLDDPIQKSFDYDQAESYASPATTAADVDDVEFFLENENEYESDASSSVASPSKKRRRKATAAPGPSKPLQNKVPSKEQNELVPILSLLLRSSSAPLLLQDVAHLPSAILVRLQRFLEVYPVDASLYHDYLSALLSTLSHLSLNRKDNVMRFAQASWDSLVCLWGTKNKGMKECLVAVLRVLFPFLTAGHDNPYDWSNGMSHLWLSLDGEAANRWGVDGLALECLRLEVADPEGEASSAFIAQTFRAGHNFDPAQALAWAILELQADCAEKLFQHSENTHSHPTPTVRKDRKRTGLVGNPIELLLNSMHHQQQSHVRAYHLQILLFFIDRHWPVLHDKLQQTVFTTLMHFISFDDPLVQSWTFLCFAAIAHCDTLARGVSGPPERDWDTIWTHAIRRTNVPSVSRTACQAAYVLLLHSHSHSHSHSSSRLSLTPQRLLLEIESLAKDLDVQGPPFPYDAVCVFLSEALRVASQDVRLYRMQFEEKALSWLVDCWTTRDAGSMPLYMVGDVMRLLETICGFSRRSDLFCRVILPECLIVETLVDQGKTKIIRDYLLSATLPEYRKPEIGSLSQALVAPSTTTAEHRRIGDDPLEEGPRERKISVFLLKSIESLASDLEILVNSGTHPTAEKARKSLDWVVVALSLEALLSLNGIRSNRRVIQAACKLMLLVTPLLKSSRWTASEKALVLLAFEPLTSTGETPDDDPFTTALLPPDVGSGIKAETLQSLTSNLGRREELVTRRLDLQRVICKSADVQDGFDAITKVLRDVLRILVGEQSSKTHAPDLDFETTSAEHATDTNHAAANGSIRRIAEVAIAFLTRIPILRSVANEPTSDKELTELLLDSTATPNETTLLIYQIYLGHVREQTLALSKLNFDTLLDQLAENLLTAYYYARSELGQMTAIRFLDSTMHIWTTATGERAEKVRHICAWLSSALKAGQDNRTHIRSWKVRDALAMFYNRFLVQVPSQTAWYNEAEDEEDRWCGLPTQVLPKMNRDDDIRVRFRTAVLNAHLFAVGRSTNVDAAHVYDPIHKSLPKDLGNYENMLTRLLCLGNMMIVSSAVRRGAYWHVLEVSLKTSLYLRHTEAILGGVSRRLGLPTFAVLFEAYASQFAYTIKINEEDFLRFQPSLLGYAHRKDCAEASFLAFTPTNLVGKENSHVGLKFFEGHCKVLQKPVSEGIRDCFAHIVGYQILQALLDSKSAKPMTALELEALLLEKTMTEDDPAAFRNSCRDNVDGVVSWIVRTLGDQDFWPEGPIGSALEAIDQSGESAAVFRALVLHRRKEDFETHCPNVPSFPASTVLQALAWFDSLVPDADVKATAYHVTHDLFAAIQKTPLVNEQFRLSNALCLWIAFRQKSFQDPTLLHALIRGATSLLAQSDLARAAQSMLEWVFDCYHRAMPVHDPCFPDVLIRICCIANDYARKPPNSPLHALGKDLRTWIDGQVLVLSTIKSKTMKASLTRALSAWPHTPSSRLTELFRSTSADLSAVLSDPSIVSNKFRLVRQLRNHARDEVRDKVQFAETDFWRLRECIPSSNELQDEDIDAFAGLLILHEGQISSFDREQPSVRSKQHPNASAGALPQNWIIQVLLTMLEASDSSQVHVAYETLRFVMSVSAPDVYRHLPPEYRDELRYLQAYKRTPKTRPARNLDELLSLDVYLNTVGNFPRWVGLIATLFSDILSTAEPFYAQLSLILQSDATFTEQTVPFLVHSILESERIAMQSRKTSLSDLPGRKMLSDYFTAVLKSGQASIPCVRSIVDIVLHLRHSMPQSEKVDALAYDKWLAIDYTLLARNAIRCGAYTTSLLFLELAVEYSNGAPNDEWAAEQILYEIYSHIDEPDGFYGIKTQDLHQFLIKRFHHEKQWEKAFRFHSAALEGGSTETAEADGLLQSFHAFGFNHLAIDTLQSSSFAAGTTFNSPGMNYRLGWRTETWDLPERKGEKHPGAPLYNALRAVYRERNRHVIQSIVRLSVSEEMGRLRALGSENLAEIRDAAQNLMCLNQVAEWFQPKIQDRLNAREVDLSKWTEFINLGTGFVFSDFENVMATRISLVRSVRRKKERGQIGTMVSPFAQCLLDVEKQCLIRLSQAARDAQQVQIALNSVIRAQRLERSASFEVSEEFASVLRLHNEEKLAVQFLKDLDLKHLPHSEKAIILARLGTWMAEARLENPTDISKRYFEPATSYANRLRVEHPTKFVASHAKVFHQYAIFAEHQYKAINGSPDSMRWRLYVDRKRRELKLRKSQGGSSAKVYTDAQKLLEGDQDSYRKHNSARETFLAHAIEMYSRALETSDAFDGDGAIRLCSLWFENFSHAECDFQDNVRTALDRIPSRKLVFLAHQLSARLSKTGEKNQETLERVVLRMCREHPFHSLYQVYCLLPHGQQQPVNGRRQSSRHDSPGMQSPARSEAATDIFDRLRSDAGTEQRVRGVELVANACLEWAKFKIRPEPKQKVITTIPAELAIRRIAGVEVPVLTLRTPLDASCKYENCVFIDRFETTFETAGGVNLPKICKCVGMDGARYKQLFKGEGNDDLRQDAVMAQVFELCNVVLQGDRETARRSLCVRNYRIIPLGLQAGVIEFVANTTPLQSWLTPAHAKYNKHDWPPQVVNDKMRKAWEHSTESENLFVLYQEIKKHFHPVLRHFFTAKHKTPMAWFAMRLNYIRSVATTSIVGHVLGLGDRHGSNILLDAETGEMVHIDLGIAFDQGKLLKVPERVPFRMTADVVDAMGAAGTQGVFQRCAEETLRVLREGSEVILTVLEVFKHDPLHSWTASEIKLNRVQKDVDTAGGGGAAKAKGPAGIGIDMASGAAEEAADRALTSVARKLDKAMSVEYTVNELLAQATDPMLLATMWRGWGAIY